MLEAIKNSGSKKTWASWCGGDEIPLHSAEHRVDSLGTIVIMCVLDFATWEAFFVCIFDGLRRPTERDRHTPESANEKTLEDIDLKAAPNSNGRFSKE